jgi:hypothetical protein
MNWITVEYGEINMAEVRRLNVPLCIIVSDNENKIEKKVCLANLEKDEEIINYINLASRLGMITEPGIIV